MKISFRCAGRFGETTAPRGSPVPGVVFAQDGIAMGRGCAMPEIT